jgi:DNA-binding IclR family transcriptional regulator
MGTVMAGTEPQEALETGGTSAVQSLSRGLAILGQFTADSKTLSVTELSRKTGLHRGTVYRFVKTLENEGYLISLGAGLYGIGPAWAFALYTLGSDQVFSEILESDLRALAESSQETAAIGVRRGDNIHIIHHLPQFRSFVPVLPPVRVHPLYETWNVHCQILLAFADENTRRRMLAVQPTRYNEHTVVDPVAVRERLDRVREEGVAFDREEFYPGTCAVGVPVMSRGRAVAVVALIVPVERFTDDGVASFIRQLRSSAERMGGRLDAPTSDGHQSSAGTWGKAG